MKEGVRNRTQHEVRGDEWEQSPSVSFSAIDHTASFVSRVSRSDIFEATSNTEDDSNSHSRHTILTTLLLIRRYHIVRLYSLSPSFASSSHHSAVVKLNTCFTVV